MSALEWRKCAVLSPQNMCATINTATTANVFCVRVYVIAQVLICRLFRGRHRSDVVFVARMHSRGLYHQNNKHSTTIHGDIDFRQQSPQTVAFLYSFLFFIARQSTQTAVYVCAQSICECLPMYTNINSFVRMCPILGRVWNKNVLQRLLRFTV